MRKLYRLLVVYSVMVVISERGIPAGWADDDKAFPGSMCVPQAGSGGSPLKAGAGIFNADTTTELVVLCPIVRDSTKEEFSKIEVVVNAQSSAAPVSCSAFAGTHGGTASAFQGGPKTTNGIGNGKLLSFSPATQWDLGPLWVECSLPPARTVGSSLKYSGVASYFITEP